MWVARDENWDLFLFMREQPYKHDQDGYWTTSAYAAVVNDYDVPFIEVGIVELPSDLFPEVKWEDEAPRKVKLVLEES